MAGPTVVFRLDMSYDGAGFHGYARQPGLRTVQGELEQALSRVLGGISFTTEAAGRTDAGVHARQQVVAVSWERGPGEPPAPDRLAGSLSKLLAPEITVFRAAPAPAGFSARFDAVRRTYRYRILNREFPDPLRRHIAWHVKHPLDVEAMNQAVEHLRGEHDFASFCRRAEGRSTVRKVESAVWSSRPDDMLRFEISASAFCHQMVRSITAWSVEVGRGRRPPESTPAVLAAQDRATAAGAAPPQGLTLWQVDY